MNKLLAEQFVALVLGHSVPWEATTELPDEALLLIQSVLSAAGFTEPSLSFGTLKGNYREQDGSASGETYPINRLSPLTVRSGNRDKYLATGWLDCAFRRVHNGVKFKGESVDELAQVIEKEIARSVPLKPIVLTAIGDELREYPPSPNQTGSYDYFVEHSRDDGDLTSTAGVHGYCNGLMDRKKASTSHDVIICRDCRLRIPFPNSVKTYGELRAVLASALGISAT